MERICKKCEVSKDITEFRITKKSGQGRRGVCKACEYGHEPHKKPTVEKTCTICGEVKSIDNFSIINKEKNYRQGECRQCKNKHQTDKRQGTMQETKRTKKKRLKSKYNLSIEQYSEMIILQDSKCKICNNHIDDNKSKVCVDHNHTTGKVRGLLCNHCNSMLGFAKDNIETLKEAIVYLNYYKE